MHRPPLTRFHVVLLITFCLCVAAWALKSFALFFLIVPGFGIAFALGIALPQVKLFGPFVCEGKSGARRVALTFDDGPDPKSTAALLDLLREANVKAAFFCIGKRIAAHPEVAARIVHEGHLLANHSWSHSYLTNFFGPGRLSDEMFRTQSIIEQSTGARCAWFRPPMGLSNPLIFKVARSLDLGVVGWTVRGLDTQTTSATRIVNRIEHGLKPGAIILLHDGEVPPDKLRLTVKTLLDRLRSLNYEVVRLDHLLA